MNQLDRDHNNILITAAKPEGFSRKELAGRIVCVWLAIVFSIITFFTIALLSALPNQVCCPLSCDPGKTCHFPVCDSGKPCVFPLPATARKESKTCNQKTTSCYYGYGDPDGTSIIDCPIATTMTVCQAGTTCHVLSDPNISRATKWYSQFYPGNSHPVISPCKLCVSTSYPSLK